MTALLLCSSGAQALCRVKLVPGLQHINFTPPASLTIPRDTPNGTVLYSEKQQLQYTEYVCDTDSPVGLIVDSSRGEQPASGNEFPLGTDGLAVRFSTLQLGYHDAAHLVPKGTRSNWGPEVIEVIKRGNLSSASTIKPGRLATYVFGEAVVFTLNLNNSINIVAASCEIPDISVEMGSYTRSDFDSVNGSTSKPTSFNIKLNNCPPGITKVSYKLMPSTNTIDYRNGVFKLSPDSTAKDIALQIKKPDDTPVVLKDYQHFNGYDTNGGNFEIPLTARYYRLGKEPIKAGSANGELTVVMEYL
ncbi:fimbrial protein [Pseudomonas spelaei]|nr:fimbrial protein [Pseudomonas spelaei]